LQRLPAKSRHFSRIQISSPRAAATSGEQVLVARGNFSLKILRVLDPVIHWMESQGAWTPWLFLALFLLASFLMIWRLEAMNADGFEGTVLGTLVMPYCSGMGNLIFAYLLGRSGGNGADVMINSLVNNITNMTLVLGLPAIFWGMHILPQKKAANGKRKKSEVKLKAELKAEAKPGGKGAKEHELNRLSLLLTLTAVVFFTGVIWAMGRKGHLDFNDGLVLIGLFLFWQVFHVFEVLKANVRQGKTSFNLMLPVNLALLGVGAVAIYISTQWLVGWVQSQSTGFVSARHLGWLSGWLMVLPNAALAFYYAWRRKPEVVYTSQVGDAHISIPLCLGIFALFHNMTMPSFFQTGMYLLLGATAVHMLFVALFGRLPRLAGFALVGAYGWFLWKGLQG
jgi:cation:H+ antiporter